MESCINCLLWCSLSLFRQCRKMKLCYYHFLYLYQEQELRKRKELEAKERSNALRQNQRQDMMHKRAEEIKK